MPLSKGLGSTQYFFSKTLETPWSLWLSLSKSNIAGVEAEGNRNKRYKGSQS